MMQIYAIGDIHGQAEMLRKAHDRIARDRASSGAARAPVVHLGDLVDRGPDSRGVVDFLIDGLDAGEPWIVLKGNHDRLFSEFLSDHDYRDPRLHRSIAWVGPNMGGTATLASYGVKRGWLGNAASLHRDALAAVPASHRTFLAELALYHETPELVFVHAGIRPGVALADQSEDDLIWIRDAFLNDMRDHGRLIVHGHTPVPEPMHFGNRIDLDTGAGYGRPLTAAVFEGRDCWVLEESGRVPLLSP